MTKWTSWLVAAALSALPMLSQDRASAQVNPNLELRKSPEVLQQAMTAYRLEVRGAIETGPDDLRDDSRLTVQMVMRDGLIVPLRLDGSGVRSGSIFFRDVGGVSNFASNLDVAFVEVIHWRGFFRSIEEYADRNSRLQASAEQMRRNNYTDDYWDFRSIKLTGTLYRRNLLTGGEAVVAERVLLNSRPERRTSYGVWASGTQSRFEPPASVRTSSGQIAARVMTGADGMRAGAAAADVIVETPSGILRDSLLPHPEVEIETRAYDYPNYDGFHKFDQSVRWADFNRVGLFYKFGDHGPFDRDDWDVQSLIVDFCPDAPKGACYRKSTHYNLRPERPPLVRLNGDRSGTEVWEPFTRRR